MGLRDSTHDRKPQTRPTGSSIACRVGAMESVKDTLPLARIDPASIVFDREADPSAAEILYFHAHKTLNLRGVLDRVGD